MQYQPAPFVRRLGARLLDLGFCYGLAFVLVVPVGVLFIPVVILTGGMTDALASAAAGLCVFLAYVGTEVFLLVRRQGQTLGKGLMGLRVVPASATSPSITLVSALIRLAVLLSPFVFMVLAGSFPASSALNGVAIVGTLSLVASLILTLVPPRGDRRAIHDWAAGTRVVRAPKRKIDFREDLKLALPGKVDLTKQTV